MKGFVIAAPHSGAGKTMITLGLLRAFRNRNVRVTSAKSGPDYIDPQFHKAASGADCVNLDAWAMPPAQLRGLASSRDGELLIVEGAMGLFDGAPVSDDPMGRGSVADLAEALDLPVIIVLDSARQSQSAAAVVHGLANLRPTVNVAGVILNKIGSPRHGEMISRAISTLGIPVLGAMPRQKILQTPSRHLGLVQASEQEDLQNFVDEAATLIEAHLDLETLQNIARSVTQEPLMSGLSPLGQRIAVARDSAFAFSYPHMLSAWSASGAELSFFSPLSDEGPDLNADSVFLPGGYPELHAGKLANNTGFMSGMVAAKERGAVIYGECGGYMALGERLVDVDGVSHKMLGFLPVSTSFENPKMHLGYRQLKPLANGPWTMDLKAHEFHYASVIEQSEEFHLFAAKNSMGENLPNMGHARENVFGSFAHIIS